MAYALHFYAGTHGAELRQRAEHALAARCLHLLVHQPQAEPRALRQRVRAEEDDEP